MKIISHLVAAVLFAATLAASGQAFGQDAPMLLPVDREPLAVMRGNDTIAEFDIEIADNAGNRSRGLMFRTEFPDDRAMLFVFEQTREVSFWMENTPRSLDILFIRQNGKLASIAHNTTPFSRASIPSGAPVRFVLEINAGLSEKLGIRPGDLFVHPIISAAGKP